MQTIQVFLDRPLCGGLLSWIQDATLLWMVSQICLIRVNLWRLLSGGAVGGIFHFLLLINIASKGLLVPWIWSPYVYLTAPLFMVGAAFLSRKKSFKILSILGYFYLLSFLLAGFNWGLDIINHLYIHWSISLWWRFWIYLVLIFLLGELGWGIVHRKVWEHLCLYPIQIKWNGQELQLNALLDTGNRLHDPLTRVPVIIVEMDKVKHILPKELVGLVETMQRGQWCENWNLPPEWEERVRLLPFHSLGKEHGMLVGFRPDQIRIWQRKQEIINSNVVVGLYNLPLSPEGAFEALIPPAVLKL